MQHLRIWIKPLFKKTQAIKNQSAKLRHNSWGVYQGKQAPLIARIMGPTWGPPGSCWPQMGPMLAPCTLLSGTFSWGTGIYWWIIVSVYIQHVEFLTKRSDAILKSILTRKKSPRTNQWSEKVSVSRNEESEYFTCTLRNIIFRGMIKYYKVLTAVDSYFLILISAEHISMFNYCKNHENICSLFGYSIRALFMRLSSYPFLSFMKKPQGSQCDRTICHAHVCVCLYHIK